MTKKKKKSKVVCKECLFFNQENRCDLRKTISALAPGRKRRCHQFSPRFVKREDLIKRPREVLPEQIADVLIPLKEEEIPEAVVDSVQIPQEEINNVTEKNYEEVDAMEQIKLKPAPEKEISAESIPEESIEKEALDNILAIQESLPNVTLLDEIPEESFSEISRKEDIPESKEDIPESKEDIPKKESFFKRLFKKRK